MNSNALSTAARFKTFAGIPAANTDNDALFEILIGSVSDYVEKYCQRTFIETTYTNEVYDGTGTKKLVLYNFPVSSTATFQVDERDGDLNDNSWTAIDSNLYHIDYATGIVEFVGRNFSKVPRKYRFTYAAGYAFKNNAAPLVTLESLNLTDLEIAVWKLVYRAWKTRLQLGEIEQESIGDYSVKFADFEKELLRDMSVKSILDSFKRPVPF